MLEDRCQGEERACHRAIQNLLEFKIDRKKEIHNVDLWGRRLKTLRTRARNVIPAGMPAHELLSILTNAIATKELPQHLQHYSNRMLSQITEA